MLYDIRGGPYCRQLRELLLDWEAAFSSPQLLRSATVLTRLALHGHRVLGVDAPPPLLSAAQLLDALAGLPALSELVDVLAAQDGHEPYAAIGREAAEVMLLAGRRLPARVALGVLDSTACGWTLAQLIPDLEGNADMTLVALGPD